MRAARVRYCSPDLGIIVCGAISETSRACLVFFVLSLLPSTLLHTTRARTMSTTSTTRTFKQLTGSVSAILTLGEDSDFDEGWWATFVPVFVSRSALAASYETDTTVTRYTDPVA
jgi:hypothetical protein